ncbi:MAG TPA: dienelactone hydrolase family protein [Pirellulales bacterium]
MIRSLAIAGLICASIFAATLTADEPVVKNGSSTESSQSATETTPADGEPKEAPTKERRAGLNVLRQLRERISEGKPDLSSLRKRIWQVDGVEREAYVYVPPKLDEKTNPPLVFVFHGHGGTSGFVVRQLPVHQHWPEAVCVYAQGLPTPVPVLDPEGKRSGWQKFSGDQGDRDLKFFDAMVKSMKDDYHIDAKRVYSTGHSNGAFFTYVLWAMRNDALAATAPIAGLISRRDFDGQKSKPVLHIAGEKDSIVSFSMQERTLERVRELNGCEPEGRPAGEFCTEYTSKNGPPVVAFIHPGGHEVPKGAAKRIVDFFKEN